MSAPMVDRMAEAIYRVAAASMGISESWSDLVLRSMHPGQVHAKAMLDQFYAEARAALTAAKWADAYDEDALITVGNALRIEIITLSEAWDALIDHHLKDAPAPTGPDLGKVVDAFNKWTPSQTGRVLK